MDRLRLALTLSTPAPAQAFSNPSTTVDGVIAAARAASASLPVTRETALQVPAVQRGRNLICAIATLPLTQYGPNRAPERSTLLAQIDPQVPNVVTVAQTVEDLLFDGIGWWRITTRAWNGFPSSAQRIDPSRVHLNAPPGGQSVRILPSGADPEAAVWIDTTVVNGADMIRFDSPNPPLLVAARRAIRRAAKLEMAAERYADNPKALDYFTPAEGADPANDEDIREILSDWETGRNDGSTGYVPASLKYNTVMMPTPADLQLVQLQARAALDIANAIGLDPEDLGVSTTSRTYQNATDRRQDRINDVLAPYMRAITDRLGMNDVTRQGYSVAFDLRDYLKADPITRATVATQMAALSAITVDEIREDDDRPMLTTAQRAELAPAPAPAPALDPAGVPVQNSAPISAAFSSVNTHQTINFASEEFRADAATRTVSGLVLPFGAVGANESGKWRFAKGSIDWAKSAVSRVKLNREHERRDLIGAATAIRESDHGITASFKVARGDAGDLALSQAEDSVLDGLSAEVDVLDYTTDPTDPTVRLVTRAKLVGAALTGSPAFDDARLTSVAASNTEGNTAMTEATTGPTAPAAPAAAPAAAFSREDVLAAIREAIGSTEAPATVNPRRATLSAVREAAPYGFNGHRGQYEFSTDLFASARDASGEAAQRVQAFIAQAFSDVDTADVNELNPNRNRPDLFSDNLAYEYPIWSTINKGTLADATPFTIPRFSSATSLVAAHTEANEPSGGTYVTTGQTVTPGALSGKVEITRETMDQGGNPQLSTLIWNEVQRAWFEALEAKAVTMLDALTPTGITVTAGAADADLEASLTSQLAALQYIRGGNRFRDFFVQIDLFKALVGAVDDTGRKLFPVLNPQNATGTTAAFYAAVDIGGLAARPAWALAATGAVAASSYLFNRDDVHGWATPPQRLNFEYEVKSVWMGVWGYAVAANTRLGGVREVIYDPVA
jgi:phage head maturation protease